MSEYIFRTDEPIKGCGWYDDNLAFHECKLWQSCPKYICYSVVADELNYPKSIKAINCPLTELPPHGRLGDLDILEKQAISEAYFPSEEWATVIELIKNAPTVLGTSEVKEMRYYSEATVKKIVKDAMDYSMTISQSIPMSIEDYPSIEIQGSHWKIGDLGLLKEDFDETLIARRQLVDLDNDSKFHGLQQRDLANPEELRQSTK